MNRSILTRLFACVAVIGGCTRGLVGPDLGGIYNRAARHHDARRNPVIVIPGILGNSATKRAPSADCVLA